MVCMNKKPKPPAILTKVAGKNANPKPYSARFATLRPILALA